MLSAVTLSVSMPSVVILSVVAPLHSNNKRPMTTFWKPVSTLTDGRSRMFFFSKFHFKNFFSDIFDILF